MHYLDYNEVTTLKKLVFVVGLYAPDLILYFLYI